MNLATTDIVANRKDSRFGVEDGRDEEEAVVGWRALEKVEDNGR